MQWFRLHDEVLDDRKVQQLPPALFKHWINLLCLASKNTPRGTLPDVETIAFRLRLSDAKAQEVVAALTDAGLLEVNEDGDVQPHNWKSRQYGKPSDQPERVAERVRKHRDQERNADVTPLKRDETPLYTETDSESDTDPETEENGSPPSPSSSGKPKPQRSIKTPIPDDLAEVIPRETWATIREEQRLTDEQLLFETSQMVDHFQSKGERRPDWVAGWRKWMRSEYRQSKPNGPTLLRPPLPPGCDLDTMQQWVAYRNAHMSMPPEREAAVDAYLAAMKGAAA